MNLYMIRGETQYAVVNYAGRAAPFNDITTATVALFARVNKDDPAPAWSSVGDVAIDADTNLLTIASAPIPPDVPLGTYVLSMVVTLEDGITRDITEGSLEVALTGYHVGDVPLPYVPPLPGPLVTSGAGSPEGVVTAPVGSMYLRTDGGPGTTLYVKEAGTAATGWAAK